MPDIAASGPGLGAGIRLFASFVFWTNIPASHALNASLERFRAKWIPVRVKKTRQNIGIEPPVRFHRNGKAPGRSTMRRLWFGLLFLSLMAFSGAFAAETSPAISDPGGSPERPSSAGRLHHPKNNKRVFAAPLALPLSSAAASGSEHPATLPNPPVARPVAPSSNMWTGFYVGAGAGAAQR
jgi:hypothetical protein